MSAEKYDAIIIGSGQGGGPLANAFARAGRRTALVERVHVGGTCVNEGCSPTKTMVASARVAYLARRGADYGVEVGPVSQNMKTVRARKQGIVDSFRSAGERGLAASGVDLIRGQARFVGPRRVAVADAKRELEAPLVFINTGLRAAMPPIAGLDSVAALDSTSIMELDQVPEHLVVLGGGYVGLEFAQMFRRFGSDVTVVQRDARLLPFEDADVAEAVAGIMREDGLEVHLSAETTRVARAGTGVAVTMRPKGGGAESTVTGSHLLVAIGRRPNTDDLGLDAAGVETDARGYVRVDASLATSAPGVYALGDVKGGPAFTHISYDDFRILRTNHLEGGKATTAERVLPYTVFIDPQLGRIGMTEKQARDAGKKVRVARMPMTWVARALEMDESRGFMKAIVDAESDQILGASILGIEGGEIAAMIQIAMMGKLPYTALRDGVFSHPTLSESLNNLFAQLGSD